MTSISFKNDGISSGLRNKLSLKEFLGNIFNREEVECSDVFFIFTTDKILLKLNRQFLNHDALTDILTFQLSETKTPIYSEIYISIERVRENAGKFEIAFIDELHRVMIHGILHLCGYSDHNQYFKKKMRKREDFYLALLNFI